VHARSRRRLDRALIGVGALAAAGAAAAGTVVGNPEQVERLWTLAEVDATESASITEVIDYDFGIATDKHGIYRTIPDLPSDATVEVSSPDAPDDVFLSPFGLGTRIRIGDANQTVSGRRRYEIHYELDTLVDSDRRLAWDAVGTEWEVGIDEAEIHVIAPWEWEEFFCDRGSTGAQGGCEATQPEPGHLVLNATDLDSGTGVTLYALPGSSLESPPEAPAPPTERPPDDSAGIALPAGLAAGAGLAGGALTSAVVRRAGREQIGTGGAADVAYATNLDGYRRVDLSELSEMATTEFAPPSGIPPWQGGVVLTENVRDEHRVSWLIGAAVDGYLEIEGEGRDVTLRRGARTDGETGMLLNHVFDGRSEVSLSEYDPDFAKAWQDVGQRMQVWRTESDLWERSADARTIGIRVLGGVVALAGLALALFGGVVAAGSSATWILWVGLGGLLAGVGVAALVRGWELRVRTPAGSAAWLRVESFRRFLAASEAHHAEEAAKRGVLREYTAWAVAVGEIDRWARSVDAAVSIPAPDRGFIHVAPYVAFAALSASRAPSSSGGGFGGGGFGGGGVGGGGGGGGGGSW
jgi:hypothetical protein